MNSFEKNLIYYEIEIQFVSPDNFQRFLCF